MLVPCAINKLEVTIGHYSLKEIHFDALIMRKRMWQPVLPERPGNKPCPVPTNEYSPKGSPVGWGGLAVYRAELGLHYWL